MKNNFLKIRYENSFKKDYKKITKQGKDLEKLLLVINHLSKGINECHIAPDWLLIYCIEEDTLVLSRTGSHSELF